jgi:hypothetical protein
LTALLERAPRAGVEVARDPDALRGWWVFWHGEPDEPTMRQYRFESISTNWTL